MSDLADYIKGLRGLADFLESHDEMLMGYNSHEHTLYARSAEEFSTLCRALGSGEKREVGGYLGLARDFSDSVKITVNVAKSHTCEKVQVGTRVEQVVIPADAKLVEENVYAVEVPVYEWKCPDSFLAVGS